MEETIEKKGFFYELKKDKILLSLVVIILILGVYARFSHYNEEGLWGDDMANVPAGLLWFYPHSYFPALSSGNFPLGNLVIGAGCMMSKQDFSGVSNVKPMFYPGREILIGEALTKGEWGCHFPMYIFGVIFFFLITVFAFMILDRYSATFVTAFFAFHPYLLLMSRWIRGDIIFWTLLVASLIFLWKGYNAEKHTKKEILFFVLTFATLGLAHSAKETTPIFAVFALLIFLIKYFAELLYYLKNLLKALELKIAEKIDYSGINLKAFHKIITYSVLSYTFFFLIAFKFNPKNVYDTYRVYQQFNGTMSEIHFNIAGIFNYFNSFFWRINLFDTILFAVALVMFFVLVFKKGKTKLDRFLIYFSLLGMVLSFFFMIMEIDRIAFPFLLLFVFIMGLALTKTGSFLSRLFKINQRTIFFVFMILYVIFSFSSVLLSSPYFASFNQAACVFDKDKCNTLASSSLRSLSAKNVAEYFGPKLLDNETVYGADSMTFYYMKRSQVFTSWEFDTEFKQQVGKDPSIFDRVRYYRPYNESIRYLLVDPYSADSLGPGMEDFKKKYVQNDVFKMKDYEVYYIYDLENLKEM